MPLLMAATSLRCMPKRLPTVLNNRRLHHNAPPSSSNAHHPAGATPPSIPPPNPTTALAESAAPKPKNLSQVRYYSQRALTPVAEVFRGYGRAQRRRPWLTQILTAVGVYALGDFNAQQLFGNEQEGGGYDVVRTGRMVLAGAAFAVPWFEWYSFLSARFTALPRALAIALRVGCNQLLATPPFLCSFFAVQGLLSGLSFAEIKEKVTVAVPRAFYDGCKLWPVVSALNFWLVPLEYRALLGGVVSVGWNCYLSFLNSRAEKVVVDDEVATGIQAEVEEIRREVREEAGRVAEHVKEHIHAVASAPRRFEYDERLKIAV